MAKDISIHDEALTHRMRTHKR